MSFSERVDAAPAVVFERITDLNALPDWNDAIVEVVEVPAELVPGAVWKVRIKAMGTKWISRSEVLHLDAATGSFAYRSQTDDGNPSFADWTWQVRSDDGASTVDLTVVAEPKTFMRRRLAIHLRKPGLRREIRTSLKRLSASARGE